MSRYQSVLLQLEFGAMWKMRIAGVWEPEAVCVVMPLNEVPHEKFVVASIWPYKLAKMKESFETSEY